jgi:hypothetical protein
VIWPLLLILPLAMGFTTLGLGFASSAIGFPEDFGGAMGGIFTMLLYSKDYTLYF